jgi:hypothetical protein
VRLRPTRRLPETLNGEQVAALLAACEHLRDRFLIALLAETGMRIGQALGLRHADVVSRERTVRIVPRADNANGARAKCRQETAIPVSAGLVRLYSVYLFDEYREVDSDYVFVNLFAPPVGRPLRYSAVAGLVERLRARTGIAFNLHMLRHSAASEMIRAGVAIEVVSKILTHANVATTSQTYVHLGVEDLRAELDHPEELLEPVGRVGGGQGDRPGGLVLGDLAERTPDPERLPAQELRQLGRVRDFRAGVHDPTGVELLTVRGEHRLVVPAAELLAEDRLHLSGPQQRIGQPHPVDVRPEPARFRRQLGRVARARVRTQRPQRGHQPLRRRRLLPTRPRTHTGQRYATTHPAPDNRAASNGNGQRPAEGRGVAKCSARRGVQAPVPRAAGSRPQFRAPRGPGPRDRAWKWSPQDRSGASTPSRAAGTKPKRE